MTEIYCYISYEDVLKVYRKMIDASDGGLPVCGMRRYTCHTLDFVQSDIYYPTFAENSVILYFQFCSGHYFNDEINGSLLTLGAYFLHQEPCQQEACISCVDLTIVYHVAASNIDPTLLLRMMRAFHCHEDYEESTEN